MSLLVLIEPLRTVLEHPLFVIIDCYSKTTEALMRAVEAHTIVFFFDFML